MSLSWHVQNFVVIGSAYFKQEHSKFLSNFELEWNTVSGTGARSWWPISLQWRYMTSCCLKSPGSWLYVQQLMQFNIKENIKALHYCPVWGESTSGCHVDSPHKGPVMQNGCPCHDVMSRDISSLFSIGKDSLVSLWDIQCHQNLKILLTNTS